ALMISAMVRTMQTLARWAANPSTMASKIAKTRIAMLPPAWPGLAPAPMEPGATLLYTTDRQSGLLPSLSRTCRRFMTYTPLQLWDSNAALNLKFATEVPHDCADFGSAAIATLRGAP